MRYEVSSQSSDQCYGSDIVAKKAFLLTKFIFILVYVKAEMNYECSKKRYVNTGHSLLISSFTSLKSQTSKCKQL